MYSVDTDTNVHRLVFLGEPMKGQIVDLNGGSVLVGSTADCDVIVRTDTVSRRHALITNVDGRRYLEDLRSLNGTAANGRPCTGRIELHDGDAIRFADIAARYEVAAAGSGPTTGPESADQPLISVPPHSANYDVGYQEAVAIHNVGRDQYLIEQRDSLARDIASTKSKARFAIWTGAVLAAAGFAVIGIGFYRYSNALTSFDITEGQANFGGSLLFPPFLTWRSHRVRGDESHHRGCRTACRFGVPEETAPSQSGLGRLAHHFTGLSMTFNIGHQSAGVISNVGGDQIVSGSQSGIGHVTLAQARDAAEELQSINWIRGPAVTNPTRTGRGRRRGESGASVAAARPNSGCTQADPDRPAHHQCWFADRFNQGDSRNPHHSRPVAGSRRRAPPRPPFERCVGSLADARLLIPSFARPDPRSTRSISKGRPEIRSARASSQCLLFSSTVRGHLATLCAPTRWPLHGVIRAYPCRRCGASRSHRPDAIAAAADDFTDL